MQSEWMTKQEAAKRLNLSTRSVLAMAAKGKIQKQLERNPDHHQQCVLLSGADVARIAYDREHPMLQQRKPAQEISRELVPRSKLSAPALDLVSAENKTMVLRPWLSLDLAEEYSGLPASFLHAEIAAGRLPALDVGVRKGGRWRIARRDLEAMQGRRQSQHGMQAGAY